MISPATIQMNRARSLLCLWLIALVLWTSGAGCLLCCAGSLIGDQCHWNGPPASCTTTETDFASHDCCALQEPSNDSASIELASELTVAARCCLLAARPDPAAFSHYHQVTLLQERVASPRLSGSPQSVAALNIAAPRSRSSTYLFCCVLLI